MNDEFGTFLKDLVFYIFCLFFVLFFYNFYVFNEWYFSHYYIYNSFYFVKMMHRVFLFQSCSIFFCTTAFVSFVLFYTNFFISQCQQLPNVLLNLSLSILF